MALLVHRASGFMSTLKGGVRYYGCLEEAIYRYIEAFFMLVKGTGLTFGLSGQNIIVVIHPWRQFISDDTTTIRRGLEVYLVMSSQQREQEACYGTNIVFQLAGSLLAQELSVSPIAESFEVAKRMVIMDEQVIESVSDVRSISAVKRVINTTIMNIQIALTEFGPNLITKACIFTLPKTAHFNMENDIELKILGYGAGSSCVVREMVFRYETESEIEKVHDYKIAIFARSVGVVQTDELTQFIKEEQNLMEEHLQGFRYTEAKMTVNSGNVGNVAVYCANKIGLLEVRLSSKFGIRKVCQTTKAVTSPGLTIPTPEKLGHVAHARSEEIADACVIVFDQDTYEITANTLLVRGSIDDFADNVKRATDDGVDELERLTRSLKLAAGTGANEFELARRAIACAYRVIGLAAYAVHEFGRVFEINVRALNKYANGKATEEIALIYATCEISQTNTGIYVEYSGEMDVGDAVNFYSLDLHLVKLRTIQLQQMWLAQHFARIRSSWHQAGEPKPPDTGPANAS